MTHRSSDLELSYYFFETWAIGNVIVYMLDIVIYL